MTVDASLIRSLEELSMNAWPALHTLHDDGWALRFANGHGGRRVNSVYPLYAGVKKIEEKISACEAIYRSRGQRPIFKLTNACIPANLDEILAADGYETDAPTAIQVLDLARWAVTSPPPGLTLSEVPSGDWLAAYARMSNAGDEEMLIHAQILRAIIPARRFAAIQVNGQVIACGLAVMQNGWVGFYDIRTDTAHRRQGYARGVMAALLAWAKAEGAVNGYLQVMIDNPPALALYARLGFHEVYRYWYRMKV